MKNKTLSLGILILLLAMGFTGCGGTKQVISVSDEEKAAFSQTKGDTITIADEKTEYEIIIIEPGFDFWLQSIAKPEGYYSQSYLENRNYIYVVEWNSRVSQPFTYNPN
jgi:hypothetical protein